MDKHYTYIYIYTHTHRYINGTIIIPHLEVDIHKHVDIYIMQAKI